MPPKPKIQKEQILEKALKVVREKGISALTAKALAVSLGCSTQPIFWHYESMDALKREVFSEALKIFGQALRRENRCESPYMAIGLNYIRFAVEEKELFRLLFMSNFGQTDIVGSRPEMDYILKVIEESEHITGKNAQTIYKDMWLFSHGIAVMMTTGTATFSEEEVRKMLGDVCRGLVTILKKNSENNP